MRRRHLLTLATLLTLLWPVLGQAADEQRKPNIVLVLVDDLRWDALGCTGHPFVKTPNIDRLAKEGALFRNFFVTIPLCSPSRGSFLTGQYAHRHGVIDNRDHAALSHRLLTFPRLLHDAGYETAYVGKWHMGRDSSPRPGFDRWVSFTGQRVFQDPPLDIDGKRVETKGYMTDLLTGHAVDFVKKARTKPFCLYLAHKAVHGPFTPAGRHKDLYTEDKHTPAPSVPEASKGGRHEEIMRQQLRCLLSIDEGVGKLLKALEESKQLDQTMFVFTSDNGYFWGEHGLGDKRAAYDEAIRDPLLVRYPPFVKAGTKLDPFVLNIDLAPTFLDVAGVKVPEAMHGKSLVPLLKGDGKGWRTAFLTEYFQEGRSPIKTWQAVRNERWKYVHYPKGDAADELYDLKADPHEMKNVIKEASVQDALRQLKGELTKLLEGSK